MKFLELMERVRGRGVVVVPTPSSAAAGVDGALGKFCSGKDPEITGVCEDSRQVKPGDLFVARTGTKINGMQFIPDAIGRGAVAVIYQNPSPDTTSPGNAIPGPAYSIASACVENANLAAALLVHEIAGNPTAGMKMIGITGTKGKTTVAYLLRSVLQAAGHKVGMIGTVEIDDGANVVPAEMTTPGAVELVEMFCRMKANGVTHCVMEVSSHALHQRRVAGIEWAVGIFTNLTGDHLDYHGTMEEYAAAKAMLFEGLGEGAVAVVNGDDHYTTFIAARCKVKTLFYGALASSYRFLVRKIEPNAMMLDVTCEASPSFSIYTPLIGKHNAYNLLAVIAASESLGLPRAVVLANLSRNTGAPGRLQPVTLATLPREKMPFQVFVDYAHTHDSLDNVLRALRSSMEPLERAPKDETPIGRLICLFGCGGDRDRTKRSKMGRIADVMSDVVIVTSDNPRTEDPNAIIDEICTGLCNGWKESGRITIEPDRRAAIKLAISMARPGDVVLLAGKGHEDYQIIGTTKHHFNDVEEAKAALREVLLRRDETKGGA